MANKGPNDPAASKNGGCIALAVIVGLVALGSYTSKCSSTSTSDPQAYATSNPVAQNLTTAIAAQMPPVPEPLSSASITQGVKHTRLVEAAEGVSGAMIYSQNCYDALGRQFSWGKLDICGAFDVLTATQLENGELNTAAENESSYFESEAAAGRYLAAAMGAGQQAGAADKRLSALQSRIARVPSPKAASAAAPTEEETPVHANVASEPVDITFDNADALNSSGSGE